MEPLEVDDRHEEVGDGRGNEEDRQLPAQPGQQVEGLILFGECPNVVAEGVMLFPYFRRSS